MKGKAYLFVSVFAVLAACGSKNEVSVHKRIEMYEDSLRIWGGGQGTQERINAFADRYIETLKEAYEDEPKHKLTPTYVDRIHMMYVTKNDVKSAVEWSEKLLVEFPTYSNRQMVMQDLAHSYDADKVVHDKSKALKYYKLLLSEFPQMNVEDREAIKKRIENIDIPFDEYLLMQITESTEIN